MRLFRRRTRTDYGLPPSVVNDCLRAVMIDLRAQWPATPPYFWLGGDAE